jgi:hypothetical protein
MLAPGWGTGTRGGSPPGVKPVSVLVSPGNTAAELAGMVAIEEHWRPEAAVVERGWRARVTASRRDEQPSVGALRGWWNRILQRLGGVYA